MSNNYNLDTLIQPIGGMFIKERLLFDDVDAPFMFTWNTSCGSLSSLLPPWHDSPRHTTFLSEVSGSGTSLNLEEAKLCARVEALERYSGSIYSQSHLITATAEDLGTTAISLQELPQCSDKEYADPQCPLVRPDNKQPLRWVHSLELHTGKPIWIPAALVYLYYSYLNDHERIALPISTGTAAHRSYEAAVLSAILEVVERDALTILWLQQMPLHQVDLSSGGEQVQRYRKCLGEAADGTSLILFDASMDLGIPVIYGVHRSMHNKSHHTLVACSAASTAEIATVKVIRDITATRLAFRNSTRKVKTDPSAFSNVLDGTVYMADPARADNFNFLLRSPEMRHLTSIKSLYGADDRERLREVISTLTGEGMHAYAVDLTTREAREAGLFVVRVIIPSLMPLSFHMRARYLGHPRLYDLPRKLRKPSKAEAGLNQLPQPFG